MVRKLTRGGRLLYDRLPHTIRILALRALALCIVTVWAFPGCAPLPSDRTLSERSPALEAGPLAADASRQADEIDLEAIERRVMLRVNAERTERSLPPFERRRPLDALARAHSADMAQRQFFSHTNPSGEDPTQRGMARGIECIRPAGDNQMAVGLGENLFSTYLFSSIYIPQGGRNDTRSYTWKTVDALADEAMEGWMNSRGHRLNLLSRQYQTIGIGAARDNLGQLYLTQNFC